MGLYLSLLSLGHTSLNSRGQPLEAHLSWTLLPQAPSCPQPFRFFLCFRPESLLASLWDPVSRLHVAEVPLTSRGLMTAGPSHLSWAPRVCLSLPSGSSPLLPRSVDLEQNFHAGSSKGISSEIRGATRQSGEGRLNRAVLG